VTTLGPGQRVGIWFQGCSIRCPGCISADTWAVPPAEGSRWTVSVADLIEALGGRLDEADGVTVSGGEPFDQLDALEELLHGVQSRLRGDQDVLVFSGHELERILPIVQARLLPIDALISDPFLLSSAQTIALRGSDNQRLTCLTPLGQERYRGFERARDERDKALDLMMDDDGTAWFADIPDRSLFAKLQEQIERDGGRLVTSQDMFYKRLY
jgi:anaerobic ribonucleoside-triphosphate reductase activating protein